MTDTNGVAVKAPEPAPKRHTERTIELVIELGDVKTFSADVLALKYAQQFHGVDRAMSEALTECGVAKDDLRAPIGKSACVETRGAIYARHALFVGVAPLKLLRYTNIHAFAREVLRELSIKAPHTRHVFHILDVTGK